VAAIKGICGSDPDGGPAYDAAADRLFVPCEGGGIQVVDLDPGTAPQRLSGADGAPIITGSTLWALQYPEGRLVDYLLTPGGYSSSSSISAGSAIPSFVSPSAAGGLLLVPTDRGVAAFRGAG
jgi:hypothetical protein